MEKKTPNPESLKAVSELAEQMFRMKVERDEAEKEFEEKKSKLHEAGLRMREMLQAAGLESFKHPRGSVFLETRTTVKVPADPAAKQLLFNYFREKGIFDAYVTFNANSLSAWYRAERELAEKQGNYGFAVPGITEVNETQYTKVSVK